MSVERGRVWVLEDSALEAEMARRALSPTHDVELFADGAVILERLANSPHPDAIVLDWQLPGVSGLEVCRFVRAQHDAMALPLLMLTSQGRKDDVVDGLAAGANDYVTKPYDVTEVVARVAALVRSARLHKALLERARELELGAALGAALASAASPAETARQCAEALVLHLDAFVVELWSVGRSADVLLAAVRRDASEVPTALIRRVADDNKAFVTDDLASIEGLPAWQSARGLAILPLVAGGQVVGVVALCSTSPVSVRIRPLLMAANLLAAGVARARVEDERNTSLVRESNARADAEAANRSKDEFLAMVSHELRTPLNAITGWSTLLMEGTLPPERVKRALQVIDRNARAQAQLIDDLLDVSRITSGRLRLEVSPVDVPAIALLSFEALKLASEAKGLTFDLDLDAASGLVLGDPDRIQQIIWNLLSNAIKFTPSGGKIALKVARTGSWVEVSVSDAGQGISPEFLPYVFDRFKQGDGSATRHKGGLGLGLAIVRHLVELHGGEVAASSEGTGKGATFSVRLPLSAHQRAEPPERSFVRREARPLLDGLRILVVDDEQDSRDLLQTVFEAQSAAVTVVSSAADAFDEVQRSAPDVLISDLAMPGEDGLSLIRRVRAARNGGAPLPAVAVSAYARLEDRDGALNAGFDAHVPKPVDLDVLFAVVERLVVKRE